MGVDKVKLHERLSLTVAGIYKLNEMITGAGTRRRFCKAGFRWQHVTDIR